ncbi:MAG TPA: hypothetical protein VJT50_12360 [Pyrinomonadaceae bacterium]|nr:hypothetical protein [Pyrinomonadaceae bacterium]
MKTNLALCVLILSMCGLLGGKGVKKEQVNVDLAEKSISAKDENDGEQQWAFKDDSYRCFAPSETPNKVTDTDAMIPINVSSIRIVQGDDTPVLFGEMVLYYKKDNGNWVLDRIEPKDVRTRALTGDAFSKFLDLQKPLCNYFKYRSPSL